MDLQIRRMSELDEPQVARVFELFAEGFYFIFSPISKDKAEYGARRLTLGVGQI